MEVVDGEIEVFLTIHGEPKSLLRPRVSVVSGKTVLYEPKENTLYKRQVRVEYYKQFNTLFTESVPLAVNIVVYKKIPTTFNKKKSNLAEQGGVRPTSKPDIDNYGKMLLDALNGVAYEDDKQIVELTISKRYSSNPRAEIRIRPYEEEVANE